MDRDRDRSSHSGSGPGPIPNRWLHCPRTSESFIADRFLAFKTPLNSRFAPQMAIEHRFQPDMVFSLMKMYKKKLGLWVDLTNTKRFYDRNEVETRDCRYTKLQCRGHGETPSAEQRQSFHEIVDEFVRDHPLEMIGVHCTHGFNRTGFLIVAYMVERMDCELEAALLAFAHARPPGIYKADYIEELYKLFEPYEKPMPAPEMPLWCNEFDDDNEPEYNNSSTAASTSQKRKSEQADNEHENDDEDGESSQASKENGARKKRRKETFNPNATFMAGVPGVERVIDQPRLGTLQATIQQMCKWNNTGFPGSQPVSMAMSNIQLLHRKPYRVSWKADGIRYMMLILKEGEVYFYDRDNAVYQAEGIRFPLRSNINEHLINTLIDGEMVIDKVNGLSVPRYLVYDIIRFMDEDFMERPFFPDRLKCIKEQVVEARYKAMEHRVINKQREPFSVRDKGFWDVAEARKLLEPKFAQSLCHEPDGLIFQPSMDPYVAGRCDDVLKWKPADMNSVDFKLKIEQDSGLGCLNRKICKLFVGGLDTPFAQMKYTKQIKDLNGKIIECKFENSSWVFMRERTDKSFPNSFNTAKAVCESIKCPVTKEILLQHTDVYRFRDDSQIMPPPRMHASMPPHFQ